MRYLITFVQKHEDFRLAEFDTILLMHGLDKASTYSQSDYKKGLPYLVATFPTEAAAAAVCARGVLIKQVMELWADAASYEALAAATRCLPEALVAPYRPAGVSWAMEVEAFGLSLSVERQNACRAHFSHLGLLGPVQCRSPRVRFRIVEEHTPGPHGGVVVVPAATAAAADAGGGGSHPRRVYFGRDVAESQSRKLVNACDLKKRLYLGPTSMDNELSLVMANMACVRKGSVVLDPFVGTGSILVACANQGAFCFGTDIDVRVLKGKDGQTLFSNFDQYGLARPEIVRCDASVYARHFRCQGTAAAAAAAVAVAAAMPAAAGTEEEEEGAPQPPQPPPPPRPMYDAIVCDPPYGIRAGARKSGHRKGPAAVKPIPADMRSTHIPHTQPYPVEDVLSDLLDLAAQNLVLGGRLVFIIGTTYDFTDDDLPRHPCLKVVANSEQPLNQKMGRRLITMKKITPFVPEMKAMYDEVASASVSKPFSDLREKMQGDTLAGSLDRREAKRLKTEGPLGKAQGKSC